MPWTVYAIMIVFGFFVILMIIDPRLSCFSRKISSPLYPIMRKKKQKRIQAEDYGFSLVDEDMKLEGASSRNSDGNIPPEKSSGQRKKKALKTEDYGFHLGGEKDNTNGKDSGGTAVSQDK